MLLVGVTARGVQIRDFMTSHLNQLPMYGGTEERVIFVDPKYDFYGYDLVQNDPFLRGSTVRMLSAGAERNADVMQQWRPRFHKVYADDRGEVWSAAGPSLADRH
jgi:hypothetical protein